MGTHLVELLRKIGASVDELPMELPRSSEIDGKNFERSMLTSQLQARCKAIGNGIGNGKMTAILSSNLTPIRGLTGERASVVLFGDSLTQRGWSEGGWCSSVADLFRRRADVYNRGYGGYNSRWARYLLPHMFPLADDSPAKKHFLVVVWFGTNDALHPSQNSHVPLEEYAENVRAILAHVQEVRRCLKAIGSLCLFHPRSILVFFAIKGLTCELMLFYFFMFVHSTSVLLLLLFLLQGLCTLLLFYLFILMMSSGGHARRSCDAAACTRGHALSLRVRTLRCYSHKLCREIFFGAGWRLRCCNEG